MGRLPANCGATTSEAKWVLSSDSTRTVAPGRPARISSAMRPGVMGGLVMGPVFMPRVYRGWGYHSRMNAPGANAPAKSETAAPDAAALIAAGRRALGI